MPFVLSGSENDKESGALKIKPGTSNVVDPLIKFHHFYGYKKDHEYYYGMYYLDASQEELEELKKEVLNGYLPVIVVHAFHYDPNYIVDYKPLTMVSNHDESYMLTSWNWAEYSAAPMAYFGEWYNWGKAIKSDFDTSFCIFVMDKPYSYDETKMELLYYNSGLWMMDPLTDNGMRSIQSKAQADQLREARMNKYKALLSEKETE